MINFCSGLRLKPFKKSDSGNHEYLVKYYTGGSILRKALVSMQH
jgi:hypothetical protein